MKVIRLIIYNTSLEANSIIGRVENEDVHSLIFNEKFYTLMPHYIQIFETGVHEMILEEEMGMATETHSVDKKVEVFMSGMRFS
ncbi:MAG: hypothetical protein RBT74_10010 [Tenuifilaceae bacterium]|jgi:hypothetical protein|nr:hypothetical protein [Tenuifilaceae bacterium]